MVESYFKREEEAIISRKAETEMELEILEKAFSMVENADLPLDEKEELKHFIAGQQERDHSRLNLLEKKKRAVSRILEILSVTAVL